MERSPSTATILIKTELTAIPGKEVLVALAEVAPHFTGSPHHHAGDEVVYMLEGSITFTLDGKPDVAPEGRRNMPHFGQPNAFRHDGEQAGQVPVHPSQGDRYASSSGRELRTRGGGGISPYGRSSAAPTMRRPCGVRRI